MDYKELKKSGKLVKSHLDYNQEIWLYEGKRYIADFVGCKGVKTEVYEDEDVGAGKGFN